MGRSQKLEGRSGGLQIAELEDCRLQNWRIADCRIQIAELKSLRFRQHWWD